MELVNFTPADPEATFKCGQKSQIMRCRTCSKRRIVRQSAAKIVKLCGEIAAKFP